MIDADLSMLLLPACANGTPHMAPLSLVASWCGHLMVTRDNVDIDFSLGNSLALSIMRVAAGLNPHDNLSYITSAMTSILIPRKLSYQNQSEFGLFSEPPPREDWI